MLKRLFYVWRLLATGFCFAVFGVGSLILCCLFFPFVNLLIWNKESRITVARKTVQRAFQGFIGMMHLLCVLRYNIVDRQRLDREGLLILANHPSLIDTVFLMAMINQANCVLKTELQSNFFTRGVARAANYIFNNQGPELLADCVETLQHDGNLIIFPEGTRSPADGQMHFKRGAANIAVRAQRNITPVIIRCHPRTLGKGEKWWHIPPETITFHIQVMDDIAICPFIENAVSDVIAVRHLNAFLQTYFIKEVQRHAGTRTENTSH